MTSALLAASSRGPLDKGACAEARAGEGAVAMGEGLDIVQLYRRYGDMVLNRCRTLLRNEADAQEAAQDVFLRLHRYREGFRGEASPSTYLFKITTTTCLNRLRSRRRRPEDPVEEVPARADSDSLLDALEVRDLVDRLLEEMDEATQAAVVHHFVDGMTHEETGRLLGITGAAVRKRISTFRSRLRANPPPWLDLFEEEGP